MTTFEEYQAKQERAEDIECARRREWAYFLGAYLTGPIVPAIYWYKDKKNMPFLVGFAAGVVTLPFMLIDMGLFSSLPAAGIATAAMHSESKKSRRKLEVVTAEQADYLKMKEFSNF